MSSSGRWQPPRPTGFPPRVPARCRISPSADSTDSESAASHTMKPSRAARARRLAALVREIQCLVDSNVSLLGERRSLRPWGLAGGGDGATGADYLVNAGRRLRLAAKTNVSLKAGDRIRVETPGGGGWGEP